jgi:chromosomal replication initiation ATPase DnaA
MHIFQHLCEAGTSLRHIDIRKTRRRTSEVVRLKSAIAVILTKQYGLTTVEVGKLMGKDHTTVVHYRKEHYSRYRDDDEYAYLYDQLSTIASQFNDPTQATIEDVVEMIRKIGA